MHPLDHTNVRVIGLVESECGYRRAMSTGQMRAAVVARYGPPEVVRVAEVTRPRPKAGELLVRVLAAPVTSGDARIRGADFPPGFGAVVRLALGIRGPRRHILGVVFAGVVEEVGADVDGFAVGDDVCGMTGAHFGTHAEFVAVPSGRVVKTPVGVSADDAAGVLFGGTTALYFLRDKAAVGKGTTVLVNGASGAVGTNAVQLARHFGAHVTAVTGPANVDLVRQLGAADVIDHTTEDVTATGRRFDVVLDCIGNLSTASGRRLLADDGVLVLVVASLGRTIRPGRNVVAGSAPERAADFARLLDLVASGDLVVVHDSSYSLDDIVDAYRRVDTGHKRGNVVVRP